jgi:signal transduction histidine kinase
LSRVFELLFATKGKGMGLRLALSKKIIKAHGGSIYGEAAHGHIGEE